MNDLPLTPIPAHKDGDTLAVFLSGDGGWRDIDRTVGDALAQGAVAVVGWDTLRYFWTTRSSQQLARDLVRVIRAYGALWNRRRVLLIGYSFGADVLPAAYNLLPPDVRAQVGQVTLLGASATADFQFHVEGLLGLDSGKGIPVAPELAKMDKSLIQCIYGEEDDEEVCTTSAFNGAHRVKAGGGHHYEGHYDNLAGIILDLWNTRAGSAP